ncbi:MAG: hypothetical protein KBS66_06985 [Eubacterium sp.]|nr:hypothetical protein [Candidatus Colimonas fimequi]
MDSILVTVKQLLGISEDDDYFDPQIIALINDALSTLAQLGVGPEDGFVIYDDSASWTDFLGETKLLESVKTYVYLSVKVVFDPPTSPSVVESFNRKLDQLEWRLNARVDHD